MKFVTRRREIEAVQIPTIAGNTPESYLAALKPVVEFLDRHATTYILDVDGNFDAVVISDQTGTWTPDRGDWLVADPTSENDPITLYTDDEFPERFLESTSYEEYAQTKARAVQVIREILEKDHIRATSDNLSDTIADALELEDCLAYDDARDISEAIVPMRETLIENIKTVWRAMTAISGEVPPRDVFAITAVGALVDTLHGREWEAPPTPMTATGPHMHTAIVPNEDAFAATEAAVNAYHEQHGRRELGPMLGWFLVRDYETAIAIVTSAELPRKQLSGMIHEAARVVDRGEFS